VSDDERGPMIIPGIGDETFSFSLLKKGYHFLAAIRLEIFFG